MAHPIYRFGEILRELRKGAGLTVLEAAEATEYGNYERWESGATRVGAQHLGAIAEAFDVDDAPMFLYAWLVDRFSPTPKQGAVDLAQVNFAKTHRQLPNSTRRHALMLVGGVSAGQRRCGLTARYRP